MSSNAKPQATGGTPFWQQDLFASMVVFLVALPLCLGIAVACGVPPALGLVAGIIGGLVVGSLSGCSLQVSGPAAGLTVLVFDVVQRHGLSTLGVVVLAAGALQVLAGTLKVGRWFRAVSPAVIQAMLAAIGVLIVAGQFHVMLGYKPKGSGLPNLLAMPGALYHAVTQADGVAHLYALGLGALTILALVAWKYGKLEKKTHMLGALPAIALSTLTAWVLQLPVDYVSLPDSLVDALRLPSSESLSQLIEAPVLLAALSMALIASAETLLSAGAVDQLSRGTQPTRYNKELIAQGVGNMLSGFLGALPITGVIARSTANIEAGAKTRLSAILHGLWLLAFVLALPFVLKLVPIASLAALLLFVAFKLLDVDAYLKLRAFSRTEGAIYLGTVAMIVFTDLLTGVLFGLVLALVKLVWLLSQLDVKLIAAGDAYTLKLKGAATFLGLPRLSETLAEIPEGTEVHVDFSELVHIDHACIEVLKGWDERQSPHGGKLIVDWNGLVGRYREPAGLF